MAVRAILVIPDAEKFRDRLAHFDTKISKQIITRALRAGAKIIQAEAKQRVPVDTGALRKSIRVRTGKVRQKGEVKILVTTSGTDNAFGGNQFYGGFVEFGYRKGKASEQERGLIRAKSNTKDGGKKQAFADAMDKISTREKVPARPFMRPAFDNKKYQALDAITAVMSSEIEREWGALFK